MATVTLAGSEPVFPFGATSGELVNGDVQLKISIAIRRSASTGITLEDYASGLISGGIKHKLNQADFDAMFAPNQADIDAVIKFANNNNLTVYKIYTNSATIKLIGSVRDINQAFGITLQRIIMPSREYISYIHESISIPQELDGIILAVFGLDNTLEVTRSASPSTDTRSMTPQQIATVYNFPAVSGQGQCVGVIEFGGGYTEANLTGTFLRAGITPTPNVIGVSAGGTNTVDYGAGSQEVMLDVYIAAGLIPQGTTAVYFGVNSVSGWWNAISTAIHDTANNPSVLSISWGAEENWWGGYINALDTLFLTALVKGITVVVSTGDYGSKATSTSPVYTVQYPASSPLVLACGGTVITNNNLNTEVVWNDGGTGSAGGVSRRYAVPTYQQGLTTKKYPNNELATITGRAVPDVSGHAVGYQFYFGAGPAPYGSLQNNGGGTSAVAPLYAGLIARINQAINGRCGFINGFVYNNRGAFHDVTQGNNACPPIGPNAVPGYSATTSWDACTGLGSPDGVSLLRAVVSQPAPETTPPVVYPAEDVGTRPTSGQTYPRTKISQTS